MDPFKAIAQLLGIQDVFFKDIRIYKRTRQVVFIGEYQADERHCRDCHGRLEGIHDWQWIQLQAPPMGVYSKVTISLKYSRGRCERCRKISTPKISWIHPKFRSVTCGFSEVAGRMMEETTGAATHRLLHTNAKKLWSMDQYRMQLMLERMRLPPDIDLSHLSADEVHFRTIHLGKNRGIVGSRFKVEFITNLVSFEDGKVLFNAPGRDSKALEECFKVLSPGQKLAVEKIAVDIHDPFISTIQKTLPNAEVCIDRFHLAMQINKVFDQVRKDEFKKAKLDKNQFQQNMLSPSRRFILVEREKHLTKYEKRWLEKLRDANKNIHVAMLLVEQFHLMLDRKNIPAFRKTLIDWYLLVRQSGLTIFRKFAKLIRRYRLNIEAYIKSGLTTAVSEGLNNKIKTLKRVGYSYSNQRSFQNKILQRCGYLNSHYINTDDLFYEVPNHK